MFVAEDQTGCIILNLNRCILFSCTVKFNKDPLIVEQNNYGTSNPYIVNPYVVYDLDTWSNSPLRNFTLKNCLFGVTTIVKNSDKKLSV